MELKQRFIKYNEDVQAYRNKINVLEAKIDELTAMAMKDGMADTTQIEMLEQQLDIVKQQQDLYFKEQKLLRGIKTNAGKELAFKWLGDKAFLVEVAE